MYDKKVLGLEEAEVAVRAIIEEASKDSSRPVAIAVADDRGDLITLVRMTRAISHFAYMATKKAHTSGAVGRDTIKWFEIRRSKEWGVYEPLPADMTVVQGGVAITEPGGTVSCGGVGVSGRAPDEDEALAFVGLKALQNFLWPSH